MLQVSSPSKYRDHWILTNTARARNLPESHPTRQYLLSEMRKYRSSIATEENRRLFDLLIGDVGDIDMDAELLARRDRFLKAVRRPSKPRGSAARRLYRYGFRRK